MNAGAVVGEKAAPDALVDRRHGNVRQVPPDDEVPAQIPGSVDCRGGISLLPQGFQELRREMSAGFDLRRRFRMPGLEQMPAEPDRKMPLASSGPPAGPVPARAMAFMTHEAVKKVDVEPVEAPPARPRHAWPCWSLCRSSRPKGQSSQDAPHSAGKSGNPAPEPRRAAVRQIVSKAWSLSSQCQNRQERTRFLCEPDQRNGRVMTGSWNLGFP